MDSIRLIFFLVISFSFAASKTAEEWRTRSMYQIITDRFARSDRDTTPCADLGKYCGGTWKGIENNLDYIQGMGFNAIWISPVQQNIEGGYHGYWYSDFYKFNEHFGTEQDFRDLVKACHERDIWVMVDIVANHVGYVQENIKDTTTNDYSKSVPFDKPEYYHPFEQTCIDARKYDPDNDTALETCWLAYLPDLNQSHPYVRQTLLEWVNWFIKTYEIDGLRLDAIMHVPLDFWVEFEKASKVFCVGEAFDERVAFNAKFQKAVGSMLNFPLNARLYWSFVRNETMTHFAKYYTEAFNTWPDITVLANFMNNHDIARFLSQNNDYEMFKTAIGFTMTSIGIPAIYYGDEQAFKGGDDPQNRETLWGHMNTDSELYKYIKSLNDFRRKTNLAALDQIERNYDDELYSFTRGDYFFAFTHSNEDIKRIIDNHPYKENTVLCNYLTQEQCTKVQGGKFELFIERKKMKILVPKEMQENSFEETKIQDRIQNLVSNAARDLSNVYISETSLASFI